MGPYAATFYHTSITRQKEPIDQGTNTHTHTHRKHTGARAIRRRLTTVSLFNIPQNLILPKRQTDRRTNRSTDRKRVKGVLLTTKYYSSTAVHQVFPFTRAAQLARVGSSPSHSIDHITSQYGGFLLSLRRSHHRQSVSRAKSLPRLCLAYFDSPHVRFSEVKNAFFPKHDSYIKQQELDSRNGVEWKGAEQNGMKWSGIEYNGMEILGWMAWNRMGWKY